MRPHLAAETTLRPLWTFDRVPGATVWLAHTCDGELAVLDDTLTAVWQTRLPETWKGGHAVAPDLSYIAASAPDRVTVLDIHGRELWTSPHLPWDFEEAGACAVMPDGKTLWAVVRTETGDECRLYDAREGTLLTRVPLPVTVVGCELVPHPDGVHMAAAVQHSDDAYRVYLLHPHGADFSHELPPGGTRLLTDIHPGGSLLLTTPSDSGPLVLLRSPDGAIVAARQPGQLFPEPDEVFDIYAGFVSVDRVLATSSGGRHVMFSVPDLRPVIELEYPDDAPRDWVVVRCDGVWVTADPDTGLVRLWRLTPPN